MRENARDGLIVQRMQQKLVGDIKVTPAEVRRYFKELPQDSIPYVPTQVEVQIITQQPKIPVAEIEDVKRRLREYTDRINKGESDFSTLALLYSEDRGSAIKGGETGFMGKGQIKSWYGASVMKTVLSRKTNGIELMNRLLNGDSISILNKSR